MIWTSKFLVLDPQTTLGLDLIEFILDRSREPVFYTGSAREKHDKRIVQIVGDPNECLLKAEEFFNGRNQSILDFERIFVGMRSPYDLEIARYLSLLDRRDPRIDSAGNIASMGSFGDFLEYAPLDEHLPPRLERFFQVLGEAPGNLRVLRFESLTEDFCEHMSPYLVDVQSISAHTQPPNRYERVYDEQTEELCYRRNQWFFDTGHYARLSLGGIHRSARVGPTSIIALLSSGNRDLFDSEEVTLAERDGRPPRPSVTIALTFCNHAEFFREAIASIYRQTFTDWELLLVDCGSTDGCRTMADELAAVDARVRCLDQGVGQDMSTGAGSPDLVCREARGEFLAKLGPDCAYIYDDALAQQVALMRDHPQAAMAYGQCRLSGPGKGAPATVQQLHDVDRLLAPPQSAIGIIRHWNQIADVRIERPAMAADIERHDVSMPPFAREFGFLLKLAVQHGVYVSSHYWHQKHACSAPDFHTDAEQGLHEDKVLSAYEWADTYLRKEGAHNRHTRKALRFRIWPFRHPRLWKWRYERWPAFCSAAYAWLDSLSPRHHVRWRYQSKENLRWLRCRVRVSLLRVGRLLGGKARGNISAPQKTFWLEHFSPGQLPAVAVQIGWDVEGADKIVIMLGAPDGAFVVRSEDAKGKTTTGAWVEDRAWFFLQDGTAENPRDIAATLDVMQVRVRKRSGHQR